MIALSRRVQSVRAYVDRAIEHGDVIVVPAVVITETTRGTPADAPVNLILNQLSIIGAPTTDAKARLAAQLLGRYERALRQASDARRRRRQGNLIIDALVAAEAISGGPSVLVIGDRKEPTRLVEGTAR